MPKAAGNFLQRRLVWRLRNSQHVRAQDQGWRLPVATASNRAQVGDWAAVPRVDKLTVVNGVGDPNSIDAATIAQ